MSTEHDDFKASLLNARWRLYCQVEVDSTQGATKVDIRIPPTNVLKALLAEIKSVRDSGGDEQGIELIAKVASTCVFRPGAVRSLFTAEEIVDWPYLSAVQGACLEALRSSTAVESARGN